MANTPIFMVQMLIEHGQFQEAEKAARQVLSENPQDGFAHALLATALVYQKKLSEAEKEIQQAVHLSPEHPHVHYVYSLILFRRKRWKQSKQAIEEAIRLDPHNADYYGTQSVFYFEEYDWKKALETATQGRTIDPENEQCANMMAAALIKLGRREDVGKVLGDTLRRNPENDDAHANQGWSCLYAGQTETAMSHFREALRINPENRSARTGVLEALRARNPIYRIALRYFLWMSRMNTQTRWAVVLGGFFLPRVAATISSAAPALAPVASLITILYILFAIFTWIARPMTDLLLRLDRNGRLLLSKSQIKSTNIGLILMAVAGLFFAGGLVSGTGTYFWGALGALALILPVFGSYQAPSGNKRTALLGYTAVLTLIGLGAFGQALWGWQIATNLSNIFFIGWIAFSWIANIVASTR